MLSDTLSLYALRMANVWGISPFEIFNKDVDDFILVINTLFIYNEEERKKEKKESGIKTENNKSGINDGFWDF